MTSRRAFLSTLGIGMAAIVLRFRPESRMELKVMTVASGEYGAYRWVLKTAFKPTMPSYVPILIHRCPPE